MDSFRYTALPLRFRFEHGGRHHVGDEIDTIQRKRAMVLTTAGRREHAREVEVALGDRCVGAVSYTHLRAHETREDIV